MTPEPQRETDWFPELLRCWPKSELNDLTKDQNLLDSLEKRKAKMCEQRCSNGGLSQECYSGCRWAGPYKSTRSLSSGVLKDAG